MKREELPAWAVAMGVMSDEDLEESRRERAELLAAERARLAELERLGRMSPREQAPAEWNEKKARWRSS